ncbi:hypothetical protein NQ317_014137 [Molorchus minor]|uniref:Uncharacterized protein n=1 Tax=Molorchus minor TaxID=1323400 RepID=A0ABQ9JGS5_9CUCU|nr:hypothetical protein NQ317_014137 [Molorchus minor]
MNVMQTSPSEVHLAPTGRELVQALRGLLTQAHWHTFTVLADQASATALHRPELWDTLGATPLHPTLVGLPSPLRPQNLFRLALNRVRRATDLETYPRGSGLSGGPINVSPIADAIVALVDNRVKGDWLISQDRQGGVVILMSDRPSAVRVLEDAKRLNMMDGHFTIGEFARDGAEDRAKRSLEKSDISDMHVNYLLRNDHNLLFSRGVESSKLKDRRVHHRAQTAGDGVSKGDLPAGLLSLKPLAIKVDRHLVKGAVRLLVAALKLVIDRSPQWMLNNLVKGPMSNSCWKNVTTDEDGFISDFASCHASGIALDKLDACLFSLGLRGFTVYCTGREFMVVITSNIVSPAKARSVEFHWKIKSICCEVFGSRICFGPPIGIAMSPGPGSWKQEFVDFSVTFSGYDQFPVYRALVFLHQKTHLKLIGQIDLMSRKPEVSLNTRPPKSLDVPRDINHPRRWDVNRNRSKMPEGPLVALCGQTRVTKYGQKRPEYKHRLRRAVYGEGVTPPLDCVERFSILSGKGSLLYSSESFRGKGMIRVQGVVELARELKLACSNALAGRKFTQEIGVDKVDKSLVANFEILNLVPEHSFYANKTESDVSLSGSVKWKRVGMVSGRSVRLDTIIWPGGDLSVAAVSTRARTVFRVVTALAPPFVMESELDEDGQCLRGLPCHRVLTSDKDNLTLVFNEMKRLEEEEDDQEDESQYSEYKQFANEYTDDADRFFPFQKFKYRTNCCYGLSMDLLENIAQELEFDFRLYIVADGLFGSRTVTNKLRNKRDVDSDEVDFKWSGIMGDLVSGAAHMSFAALSVSGARSEVIDFSVPYFYSGVSFLTSPQQKSEIPLMAFLLPFSPELWIAIFTSLNITAIAVAIYEWLSPFGLNPWGRQRSKNFSMSSALWVMWGLLCGHLVAFKAPKSWPNKFLINVWGGFSLLSQKVGAPRASAAEYYVQKANQEGVMKLRNGSLDILIADTPILDYYRATDHGCKLQKIGDSINEDTYAIGMGKGFPLKDSISAVIAKYSSNGYMDILQEKWYGGLPCFKLATEIAQPRPLGVAAVTGVFILLGVGVILGLVILLVEHLFFRYTLPILRDKPKGSIWRSRNIMFFSQKLYRFINCVELVSPHHAARELVHTIRQGQITSLFQKSIKRVCMGSNLFSYTQTPDTTCDKVRLRLYDSSRAFIDHEIPGTAIYRLEFWMFVSLLILLLLYRLLKEHEQRRRRKSKAQFFEMIQEIRRQQQEEREPQLESVTEVDSEYQLSPEEKRSKLSPSIIKRTFMRTSPKSDHSRKVKSPTTYFNKQLFSPRSATKANSSTALNVRRFSTDSVFNSQTLKQDHSSVVGRRLSKDASMFLTSSPPDINSRRSSYLDIINSGNNKLSGKSPILSIENLSDCSSSKYSDLSRKLSDSESIGRKLATLPKYRETVDKHRLQPQYSLTLGKSDETLTGSQKNDQQVSAAKSFTNIADTSSQYCIESRSKALDEEIAKRNRQTIQELQGILGKNPKPPKRINDNNTKQNTNPQIRIQIEDTTKEEPRNPPFVQQEQNQTSKNKLAEQSKSLDSNHPTGRERSRSRSRLKDDGLPPAPPPPNCSPRNSNGRSPLERLSKDELVLLWRSSESELRSHLLKAIRDKEEPTDPP